MKLSNTIGLFGGLIVALIIGELIVRIFNLSPQIFNFDWHYIMQFVPNAKICYKMRPRGRSYINSEGFRDSEFVLDKNKIRKRIIMLGDSITFGTHLKTEATFSYI